MWGRVSWVLVVIACAVFRAGASSDAGQATVMAAAKPGKPWLAHPTRTLEDLPSAVHLRSDTRLSTFGGWRDQTQPVTGFFYTTNKNGRWWLVDPEGCFFILAGVSTVKTIPTPSAERALVQQFTNKSHWADATVSFLCSNGFNGIGGWSEQDLLNRCQRRLPYTPILGFMAGYGRQRGGTHMQPGHLGYPNDCIFVFDPEFAVFCDEYARRLADTKDDPWLIGYFSDNELPFKREALKNYLALPSADPGRKAAESFLRARHGKNAPMESVTLQDQEDFLSLVAATYFEIVSRAIRKYDPHHLYLGSRFYSVDIAKGPLFKACGPFVDVVSLNYYGAWTPDPAVMKMWTAVSGRPVLITEWYAKGADSGMGNTGGAGWLVKTQRERGIFYENFTLGLLKEPGCVGWQWFRYSDNDPDDKGVDPSNRDSNKGIVSNRYQPYTPLLDSMRRINQRIYSLADYFINGR